MDPRDYIKISLIFSVFVLLCLNASAATLTADVCEKESATCKTQCYLVLANATQDESICAEKIDPTGSTFCYLAVAMAKKDVGVCSRMLAAMESEGTADEELLNLMDAMCYGVVAVAAEDTSICDHISDPTQKADCVLSVVYEMGDRGLCESELSDQEKIYRCYGAVAEETKDANLCELIPEDAGQETIVGTRDACFMDVAKAKANYALCEKVSSDWVKQCYIDVGIKDLDNPHCDDSAITAKGGQELSNACWYSAATWGSKPAYCDRMRMYGEGSMQEFQITVDLCKQASQPLYTAPECNFRGYTLPGKPEPCPEGYVRENGECVPEEYECPEGYREEDGVCVPIEDLRDVILDKELVEVYGNGVDKVEFTLTVLGEDGKPLPGEKVEVEIYDYARQLVDEGTLSATQVTTGPDGKASFTYTAPLPPENKRFKPYQLQVRAKHPWGNPGCYVIINDARPRLNIQADPRMVNEDDGSGEGISYFNVEIIDPDSSKWTYSVSTDLGSIVAGEGETSEKKFSFRWLAPDSKVALRDFEVTLDRDDAAAYSSFTTNLKNAGKSLIYDPDENQMASRENYFNSMKGSWDYVKEDYERLNSGTFSGTETALNMLSFGLEGLQVWAGTKGLYDSEKAYKKGGDDSLASRLKNALEGTRDAFLGYGIDRLQARLRSWADAEHEANLESIRLPVKVTVTVTDETGQEMTLNYLIQYRYFYNPKVHLDRINHPEAG